MLLDEATTEQTRRPLLRRILSGLATAVLVLAIALLVYVTFCMVKKQPVSFFGKSILQIVTGSMEPTLRVGDCILVTKTDPAALQEGDIITFVSEDPETRGLLVTHRIISREADGSFITRGDANPVEDALAVRADQVRGKYIRKLHIFGFMTGYGGTRKLLLLVVMLGVLAIAFYEVRSLMKIGKEIHDEAAEEEREKLIREAVEKEKARLAAEAWQPPLADAAREPMQADACQGTIGEKAASCADSPVKVEEEKAVVEPPAEEKTAEEVPVEEPAAEPAPVEETAEGSPAEEKPAEEPISEVKPPEKPQNSAPKKKHKKKKGKKHRH